MKAIITIKSSKKLKKKKINTYLERILAAEDLVNLARSGEVNFDEIKKKPLKLRKPQEIDY